MNKYKYLIITFILFMFLIIYFVIQFSNKTYLLRNVDGYLQKIKFDMIFISNDFHSGYRKRKTLPSEEKYYKTVFRDLIDPFSGKPYVYNLTENDEFLIYSIGPDRKDDEGTMLKYKQNLGSLSHFEYLKKNDERFKGDIVMRIKIPFSIEDFNKVWKENYGTMYDSYFFDYSEVNEIAKGWEKMKQDLDEKFGIRPHNENQEEN